MAELGTYEDYKRWDADRRLSFPLAKHWIYQSRIEEFKVAEWNPITGTSYIHGVALP